MTRFATFWVEGGRIVAPVNVMRWDDTLYRMLGENLEALTDQPAVDPQQRNVRPALGTDEPRTGRTATKDGAYALKRTRPQVTDNAYIFFCVSFAAS